MNPTNPVSLTNLERLKIKKSKFEHLLVRVGADNICRLFAFTRHISRTLGCPLYYYQGLYYIMNRLPSKIDVVEERIPLNDDILLPVTPVMRHVLVSKIIHNPRYLYKLDTLVNSIIDTAFYELFPDEKIVIPDKADPYYRAQMKKRDQYLASNKRKVEELKIRIRRERRSVKMLSEAGLGYTPYDKKLFSYYKKKYDSSPFDAFHFDYTMDI